MTFAVSAGATIALGLSEAGVLGNIGFVLSALVTSLTALESFFNWRSRWINAEEALAEWYAIKEDLRFRVSGVPDEAHADLDLDDFYRRYRDVWAQWSRSWIEARKASD